MNNETIKKAQENMDKSIKVYQKKLASIRAGVANAALLDNVQVEYYGAPTPLTQMSSITIPEPRVLLIHTTKTVWMILNTHFWLQTLV